ncbi:hypothetical protein [Cryobacterium sp. M15]|uniref:hypothetical protein n=1 Tax=Cryobacterium sp. M15 TaxID=2048291 RepID=UPI0011B0BD67|nr:hypothetical protein [Cryobacterium sp. M15]
MAFELSYTGRLFFGGNIEAEKTEEETDQKLAAQTHAGPRHLDKFRVNGRGITATAQQRNSATAQQRNSATAQQRNSDNPPPAATSEQPF